MAKNEKIIPVSITNNPSVIETGISTKKSDNVSVSAGYNHNLTSFSGNDNQEESYSSGGFNLNGTYTFGNDGNNKVTNRISAGLDTSKYVQSNGSETVESGARLGISAGQTRILTADDKKSIYTFASAGVSGGKVTETNSAGEKHEGNGITGHLSTGIGASYSFNDKRNTIINGSISLGYNKDLSNNGSANLKKDLAFVGVNAGIETDIGHDKYGRSIRVGAGVSLGVGAKGKIGADGYVMLQYKDYRYTVQVGSLVTSLATGNIPGVIMSVSRQKVSTELFQYVEPDSKTRKYSAPEMFEKGTSNLTEFGKEKVIELANIYQNGNRYKLISGDIEIGQQYDNRGKFGNLINNFKSEDRKENDKVSAERQEVLRVVMIAAGVPEDKIRVINKDVKNNDYGYVKGSDYYTNINLITNKTEKEHFAGLEKMNKDKEEAEKLAVANIASQLMDLNSAKINSNDFNNKNINIADVENNVILVEDKNLKTNTI